MATLTLGNLKWAKRMAKASLCGATEKSMTVNGKVGLSTVMVYGKVHMEIPILENGGILNQKATESITGGVETDTKESGNNV